MFHELCTKKGPTLIIIKEKNGSIFGGFNPYSWISENAYFKAPAAFLFSFTDGRGWKPVKFQVKSTKSDFAIRNSEKDWSPGFGEEGISDLFIAFKNLWNSYSRLGLVYKVPKELSHLDPETILAGKKEDWDIKEIEIFAL